MAGGRPFRVSDSEQQCLFLSANLLSQQYVERVCLVHSVARPPATPSLVLQVRERPARLSSECLMHTPHHVSLDRFVTEKALFLTTACLAYGDETMHCLRCGTRI